PRSPIPTRLLLAAWIRVPGPAGTNRNFTSSTNPINPVRRGRCNSSGEGADSTFQFESLATAAFTPSTASAGDTGNTSEVRSRCVGSCVFAQFFVNQRSRPIVLPCPDCSSVYPPCSSRPQPGSGRQRQKVAI